MRVPVSSMNVVTSLVLTRDGRELPDATRTDLRSLIGLARQMDTMIGELLRMVRIVREPEPVGMVDLGAITAEAVAALEPQIAARRVRVDVVMPLPSVAGQATKLRHVIGNLVGNAIRFVAPGTGTVVVSATREDGGVVLSVRDNGIGIPAEYHRTIFEMFGRVPDGNGDGAGSGMGLAIVKRIVGGHGGEVSVQSTPGGGSEFRVRLPVD